MLRGPLVVMLRGPFVVMLREPFVVSSSNHERRFHPFCQALPAMKVLIPGALRSYTECSVTEAHGATLGTVLADLDRQYSNDQGCRSGFLFFASANDIEAVPHRPRSRTKIRHT